MREPSEPSILTTIGQFGIYILAWLLLSAPGIWFFLSIRDSLFKFNVLLQLNPWAVRAIDRWGIFLFGLFWLAVIFTLEGYLRTAIAKGRLWQRIRRVFTWELIFAALLLLIEWTINFAA
ncbi:MAG: hypothetical protein KDE53_06555 [Caldilineaceae bacterium]|nr:hypothetical protein [Caldilineaceae bacterium]MCB0125013.1 hypothetical protein [Caldilineaceae bacterium]